MSAVSWYFIVNPISGNGKGLSVWEQLEPSLITNDVKYTFGVSNYHKHTVKLIQEQFTKGLRNFIAIGGDGTLNELVNGLMFEQDLTNISRCTIGLISIGTGNDWAKSQTNNLTVENIVSKLVRNQTVNHHLGLVHLKELDKPHYFINIAGAGIDGAICKKLESIEGKPGKLIYLKQLLKTLFTYTSPELKSSIDTIQWQDDKAFLVSASLGKFFGGGMLISPEVNANRNEMGFTFVKKDRLYVVFSQLFKLFNGKIGTVSFVEKKRGLQLKFNSDTPVFVQADGELVGETTNATFTFVADAIQVLV